MSADAAAVLFSDVEAGLGVALRTLRGMRDGRVSSGELAVVCADVSLLLIRLRGAGAADVAGHIPRINGEAVGFRRAPALDGKSLAAGERLEREEVGS